MNWIGHMRMKYCIIYLLVLFVMIGASGCQSGADAKEMSVITGDHAAELSVEDPEFLYHFAENVVIGTVVSVDGRSDYDPVTQQKCDSYTYGTFKVENVYKGILETGEQIPFVKECREDDVEIEAGKKYLVYLSDLCEFGINQKTYIAEGWSAGFREVREDNTLSAKNHQTLEWESIETLISQTEEKENSAVFSLWEDTEQNETLNDGFQTSVKMVPVVINNAVLDVESGRYMIKVDNILCSVNYLIDVQGSEIVSISELQYDLPKFHVLSSSLNIDESGKANAEIKISIFLLKITFVISSEIIGDEIKVTFSF